MTKDQWKQAIRDQACSGKTIEAFCEERGLNRKTFSVNKSVLKKRDFVQVSGARQVEVVLPKTNRMTVTTKIGHISELKFYT